MKQSEKTTNKSLITKDFLNIENNIIVFFKSIMGPIIKNPVIDPKENLFINVLATKASASEHKEIKNEKAIRIIIDKTALFSK